MVRILVLPLIVAGSTAWATEARRWVADTAEELLRGRGDGVAVTDQGTLVPVAGWSQGVAMDEPVVVAGGRLSDLTVPVSVLAAADDPVIPVDTLHALQLPAHSTLEVADHGGHCGFIENWRFDSWVERRVLALLELA